MHAKPLPLCYLQRTIFNLVRCQFYLTWRKMGHGFLLMRLGDG